MLGYLAVLWNVENNNMLAFIQQLNEQNKYQRIIVDPKIFSQLESIQDNLACHRDSLSVDDILVINLTHTSVTELLNSRVPNASQKPFMLVRHKYKDYRQAEEGEDSGSLSFDTA